MTEQKKETNTVENESTREFMQLLDGTKVPVSAKVDLGNGRIAKIAKGKGRHALAAQEEMQEEDRGASNMTKYLSVLMSQLILIDDKALSPEDILDLEMQEYNKISVEFSKINF